MMFSKREKGFAERMTKTNFLKGTNGNPELEKEEFDRNQFCPSKNTLSCFVITKDGKEVFTGEYNGRIYRRKLKKSHFVSHTKAHTPFAVKAVFLSKSEDFLFSGGSDNTVKVLNSKKLTPHRTYKVNSAVCSIISYEENDCNYLFCGSHGGRIFGWNSETGQALPEYKEVKKQHERIVHCLRLYNGTLLSSSEDRTVKQWDIQSGNLISSVNFLHPVTNLIHIRDELFLFQHFTNCELYKLKKKEENHSIGKIHRDHIFVTITSFNVTPNEKILVGWNRLLGELEFWDIEKKEKLLNKKVYDAVYLDNISTIYPNEQEEKSLLEKKVEEENEKESSSMNNDNNTNGDDSQQLVEGGGIDSSSSSSLAETSKAFFVYYLVGKYLDRCVVDREDLLRRRILQSQKALPLPHYLSYLQLFNVCSSQLQIDSVLVAQGIETLAESKTLSPNQEINVQSDRLMEYISTKMDDFRYSPEEMEDQKRVKDLKLQRLRNQLDFEARITQISQNEQNKKYSKIYESHNLPVPPLPSSYLRKSSSNSSSSTMNSNEKSFFQKKKIFYKVLYEHFPKSQNNDKLMLLIRQSKMFEDCVSGYMKDNFLRKMYSGTFFISLAVGQKIEQAQKNKFYELISKLIQNQLFLGTFEGSLLNNNEKESSSSSSTTEKEESSSSTTTTEFNRYFHMNQESEIYKTFIQQEDEQQEEEEMRMKCYRASGRILGHCLYHQLELPGFHVSETVYKLLLENEPLKFSDIDQTYPELSRKLDRLLLIKNEEELKNQKLSYFDDLTKQSITKEKEDEKKFVETFEDRDTYVVNFIKHRLFARRYALAEMEAFITGFNEVIPIPFIQCFTPDELEMLICGSKPSGLKYWKPSFIFSKCDRKDDVVHWFFDAVENHLTPIQRNQLLHLFIGEYSMKNCLFKDPKTVNRKHWTIPMIQKVDLKNLMNEIQQPKIIRKNHLLELPNYTHKKQLQKALKKFLKKCIVQEDLSDEIDIEL